MRLYLFVIILAAMFGVVFTKYNFDPVTVDLVVRQFQVPLAYAVMGAAVIGGGIMLIVSLLNEIGIRSKYSSELRALRAKVEELKEEKEALVKSIGELKEKLTEEIRAKEEVEEKTKEVEQQEDQGQEIEEDKKEETEKLAEENKEKETTDQEESDNEKEAEKREEEYSF